MRKYLPKSWPVWLILVVSAVVHFAYFGYPNQTVFDEVHFGKFITGYFTGEYFFDIHPPLAKLLMSLAGYWGGFRAGFSFSNIGKAFPDHSFAPVTNLGRCIFALNNLLAGSPIKIFYLYKHWPWLTGRYWCRATSTVAFHAPGFLSVVFWFFSPTFVFTLSRKS